MSASLDDLRTLEAEAVRRGVPLTVVLRDAVEDKARAIRESRRPRVGVARSIDGRSAAELTSEPVADEPGADDPGAAAPNGPAADPTA